MRKKLIKIAATAQVGEFLLRFPNQVTSILSLPVRPVAFAQTENYHPMVFFQGYPLGLGNPGSDAG